MPVKPAPGSAADGDEDGLADDRCGIGSALEYCVEKDELFAIIGGLPSLPEDIISQEASLERFCFITNNYQEQPHLLDPCLESMLLQLMEFGCSSSSTATLRHQSFKYLYQLTKVRGHKYVVRLMSHEVADLEPALALLNAQNPRDFETWETRYILLLWLAIIALIPFDMKLFDGRAPSASASADVPLPIMERIINVAKVYLSVTDKSRDAAAVLIAKFISRPDVRLLHLARTVDWLHSCLCQTDTGTNMAASTGLCGALAALAALYKHGRREDLLCFTESSLSVLEASNLLASNNTLLRKLSIKLVQRIGLVVLPMRVCAWRYQRGSRSLTMNLNKEQEKAEEASKQAPQGEAQPMLTGDDEDTEEFDVPELVEGVLETVVKMLSDQDTIVRWSAAKGVGRIAARLPRSLADEVVSFILDLFRPNTSHAAWHGGCLALAELGRRGLLPPTRLAEVVPLVVQALAFDQLWGSFSLGSHVRDAACYACWSFARAYDPADVASFVNQIASALIVTAVFDREINCRRAASAAFQENVGRQGQFPNGIEIVIMADYFAVGNRQNAYLTLSAQIGRFEQYKRPLIDACFKVKLCHWDAVIRDLSARALHSLTVIDPHYIASEVLPVVVRRCTMRGIQDCHGGLLAVGEICHALAKNCSDLSDAGKKTLSDWVSGDVIASINDIIPTLKEGDTLKGVHAIETRMAACRLVENLSKASFPIRDNDVLESWQWLIDDCLPYVDTTNAGVTDAALAAVGPFMSHYYSQPDASHETKCAIVTRYCQELRSKLVFPRMGFALALGALPSVMLPGRLSQVLSSLVAATRIEPGVESQFAEARRDAVKALGRFCQTAGFSDSTEVAVGGVDSSLPLSTAMPAVFDACLVAMQDYTMDSRGDIGACVREASMQCIQDLTLQLAESHPAALTEEVMVAVVSSILQQSSEKIDRTRAVAGAVLGKLLHTASPPVPNVMQRSELTEILSESVCSQLNWASAGDAFPYTVRLLSLTSYRRPVLTGLVVSVGGITESLVKHSSNALSEFLQSFVACRENLELICEDILAIFEKYQKVDRVTVPLFKMLDGLLSMGIFEDLTLEEECVFPNRLLKLCKVEISRCGDAKKLIDSIPVFCGLLQFSALRSACLQQLTILLGHKYPRVRTLTADYLLVALVSYADVVGSVDVGAAIGDGFSADPMTLLSSTAWDESLDSIRPVRNQICQALGVPVPKLVGPAKKAVDGTKAASAATQDVKYDNYQDLVNRAGY